jgi:CRISPR system Cascade subunit CasD
MRLLLLRFDAPLMSFGGVAVDNRGVTRLMPTRSMLTGLLGNALGYHHRDGERLGALQGHLRYAARCDRQGKLLVDFHTVDLGQRHLMEGGWTTRGQVEKRGGASAAETHIRYRHYLADAVFTLALGVAEEKAPNVEELAKALDEPARPLFLGRKTCLPSGPILLGTCEADTPLEALRAWPAITPPQADDRQTATFWWTDEPGVPEGDRSFTVADDRDWFNQVHTGRRRLHEKEFPLAPTAEVARV